MFQVIFYLSTLLALFSVFLSVVVGLFVGVVNLILYFIPTIDIADTLLPAAILTTVPIIMAGNVFKVISDSVMDQGMDYDEDE